MTWLIRDTSLTDANNAMKQAESETNTDEIIICYLKAGNYFMKIRETHRNNAALAFNRALNTIRGSRINSDHESKIMAFGEKQAIEFNRICIGEIAQLKPGTDYQYIMQLAKAFMCRGRLNEAYPHYVNAADKSNNIDDKLKAMREASICLVYQDELVEIG